MIKIAFFDVDGTLLQLGSKEPSPKTVQALQKLRANGVLAEAISPSRILRALTLISG